MRDGQMFLGVAVDEDRSFKRWVYSPISDLELEAIKNGAEPLRRALLKDRIIVVDYSEDTQQATRTWETSSEALPDDVLPKRESVLPGSRRRRDPTSDEVPVFHLAANVGHRNFLTFEELSGVTAKLQSLWNALARSLQLQPASLAITGFSHGSLKLLLRTDQPTLFDSIAGRYRDLVLARLP
jgi:hypothetical protein